MIRPTLNHLNLKTTRLKEMIDWYAAVTGGKIIFQSGESTKDNPIQIAFMSNDSAPFRIAFMGLPGLREDPEQFFHSGLHHMAFEYDSFADLMSSFARLKQLGIEPIVCVQHGVTTSLYYSDPDQKAVELQADNFSNWDKSAEWMSTSEAFRQNPIGTFFDPDRSSCLPGRCDVRVVAERHVGGKISPFEAAKPASPSARLTRTEARPIYYQECRSKFFSKWMDQSRATRRLLSRSN